MARYCGVNKEGKPVETESKLKAAMEWKDKCLLGGKSIFSNEAIWSDENIDALKKHFVDNPDEGKDKFISKLEIQLKQTTPEVKKLVAEMTWFMLLCPSNIKHNTKRSNVQKMWNWSGNNLPNSSIFLDEQTLTGIGSAGPGFHFSRWRELRYFILTMEAFRNLSEAKRKSLVSDGWDFAKWLESIPENEERQFRHMLLFLLFPNNFERIFGGNDRKKVASYYTTESKVKSLKSLGVDKELYRIRKEQEKVYETDELDFYHPPLDKWKIKPDETRTTRSDNAHTPINKIFYGPPGTGKTYRINNLREEYTSKTNTFSREQWLSDELKSVRWLDVIVMVLHESGKKGATVPEIVQHEFIQQKQKARPIGQTKRINQQIWGVLQQHTIIESKTVKFEKRQEPLIFDKSDKGSVWSLAGEWEDLCEDQIAIAKSLEEMPQELEQKRYEFVTFHQAYSYEDFVEGIRPVEDEESGEVVYRLILGVFRRICQRAKNDPENRYALFIDEINRGNIAKIFGELITLIEIDKRAEYDADGEITNPKDCISVTLPYSPADEPPFAVPINLDIYGTMNTADRSIALLDTALRRRFTFEELMPDSSIIEGSDGNGHIEDGENGTINLRMMLDTMNKRIRFLLNRDFMLGHAYLCKVKDFDGLKKVLINQIIPLLQEYFYEDWAQIQKVFGGTNQNESNQIVKSHKHDSAEVIETDEEDRQEFIEYKVADMASITPDAVRNIYKIDKE
ncbi:MAG: AAA family ATPase [Candidatus Dadabacteria bacterium]|nr:AAA family ATPase [Candidatus Dadabacteria bacterium]